MKKITFIIIGISIYSVLFCFVYPPNDASEFDLNDQYGTIYYEYFVDGNEDIEIHPGPGNSTFTLESTTSERYFDDWVQEYQYESEIYAIFATEGNLYIELSSFDADYDIWLWDRNWEEITHSNDSGTTETLEYYITESSLYYVDIFCIEDPNYSGCDVEVDYISYTEYDIYLFKDYNEVDCDESWGLSSDISYIIPYSEGSNEFNWDIYSIEIYAYGEEENPSTLELDYDYEDFIIPNTNGNYTTPINWTGINPSFEKQHLSY